MYKSKNENVEIYFICYKGEEMSLVETYYDEVLDTYCWYINSYLAYKAWKTKFKKLSSGELGKKLFTIAASRYLLYKIENEKEESKNYKKFCKDLEKINLELKVIIKENDFLQTDDN